MTSVATTTTEEAEGPRSSPLDRIALGYLVCIGLFSAWVSYVSFRDRVRVPIFDDWRILDDFYSMSFLEWLFSSQNGHRTSFTFSVFALDYSFFDGRQDLLVVATLATAWLAVACLYLTLRNNGGLTTPVSKIAFGFACFLLFWSGGAFNFLWGVCHGNLMVVLWLFVSLACLVRYVRTRQPPARSSHLLVFAGVAAFFATFSLGEGAATWVALIAVAIVARIGPRTPALLAVGFVATLVVYARGLELAGRFTVADSIAQLLHPITLLEYMAPFLGSAFALAAQGLGLVGPQSAEATSSMLGAIGLVLAVFFAVWLLYRPRRAGPQALLALGIMAFGVAAATLVALARLRTGLANPLDPRFVNWSATFWMGVVLAVPTVATAARGAFGSASAVMILALSLCLVPALESTRELPMKWKARATEASFGLLLGIPDRRLADRMFVLVGIPDRRLADRSFVLARYERFQRVLERLRQERRSFFASPWADLPGAPLAERLAVVSSELCQGKIGSLRSFGVPAARVARVAGSAEEQRGRLAPTLVVITDAAGIIRGLGNVGGRPDRMLPDISRVARGPIGWSGYLTSFDRTESYVAYAVLSDGRSACRLGTRR